MPLDSFRSTPLERLGTQVPQRPAETAQLVGEFSTTYQRLAQTNLQLGQYISDCVNRFQQADLGTYLDAQLQEIVYYLLSLPPFDG